MLAAAFSGFLLGLGHALEPDHVAAVSVLAMTRPGAQRGALLGLFWGLGHTLGLLAMVVAWTVLKGQLPHAICDFFELGVAFVLLGLGVNALRRALRDGREGPRTPHAHGIAMHTHKTSAAHVHVGTIPIATRPLAVGLIHGLAGSGAITAVIVTGLPTLVLKTTYVLLFGCGSIAAMATLSGLFSWPLARALRTGWASRLVVATAGAASVGLGLFWALSVGHRLMPTCLMPT